ncbi:MAG: phospholipase D-like domain-containing protein [Actinomycetota bacterium]
MTIQDDPPWRRVLEGTLGIPASEGNRVEVLRDGRTIFPAMLEAIGAATRTVDLLTFVYWRGDVARRFAEVLCDRAAAGVRCRVILDALGARHVDRALIEDMVAAGVQLHWFRPLIDAGDTRNPGHRTHRKVLVCDEEVGFVGGVGIAEEWDGSSDDGTGWRETQLRLRGPIVDGLRAAFLDDWIEEADDPFDDRDRFPVQPADGPTTAMVVRGESEEGWSDVAMLRRVLFARARRRIRITTPYFAPDEVMFAALARAASRGVQVQLLLPGPNNDKEVARLATERRYPDLLEAGIELYHFVPTMLHAKVLTVDGETGIVGSANLNHRSLQIDEEVDVVLLDPEVVAQLDDQTDDDLRRCEQLSTEVLDGAAATARKPLRLLTGLIERWT